MKTVHIFGILAAAVLTLTGMQSCSDNYDTSLMPVKSDLELKVDGHTAGFIVDYGAEPDNDIKVAVESNTLWKVSIECDGGWCTADKLTGRGNETFTLSILENITKDRQATVRVYIVDAEGEKITGEGQTTSIDITLKQAASDVRLSPSSLEPFEAQNPRSQEFTIDSNVDWTLSISYEGDNPTEFITLTPISGMEAGADGTFRGPGGAKFRMTMQDNRTAADRKAFLNLVSAVSRYTVEITQTKSTYMFDVTPSENQILTAAGGEIAFGILSPNTGWDAVSSAGWVTMSVPSADEGSVARVETVARIAPNADGQQRTTQILFKPRDNRYPEQTVTIVQRAFVGSTAAISVPWLGDGYTQTTATIEFNFYSPFFPIEEAGLEWGLADSDMRETLTTVPADQTDCTVSFELTGLNPATRYVARGYVRDTEGNLKYGDWSYPFTTAGRYPGSGDNPTPSRQ